MLCPSCGGNLVLNREFQLVCERCGIIVSQTFLSEKNWLNRVGGKRVFSERYSASHKDWIRIISSHNFYRSTHYRTIQTLQRICSRLGVGKNVQIRAVNIYFKALKDFKKLRPNYFRLIAASLIVALRESNTLIPPNEIWKAFLEDGHRFSKRDFYKALYIMRKYSFKKIGLDEKIIKYIAYILKKIFEDENFKEKIQKKLSTAGREVTLREYKFFLQKRAVQLVRSINWGKFQSKNPLASALAILYIADYILCKKLDIKPQILTQRYLSRISGIALSTIVVRLRIIKEQLTGILSE